MFLHQNRPRKYFVASLMMPSLGVDTLFFINNPFLTLAQKIVETFLKKCPKKLFSNCLIDGLLTSIL